VYLRDVAGRTTVLVSVTADGTLGNDFSFEPSISANGRYVAFTTWADDLFADRNGHVLDVVVKDMATGEVTPVSRRPGGGQSNKNSLVPVIAGNGATSRTRPTGYSAGLTTTGVKTSTCTSWPPEATGLPRSLGAGRTIRSPCSSGASPTTAGT